MDDAGLSIGSGPIRLLCYPRMLGYVFNPLSAWSMVKTLFSYPLMTLKVIGGIHW